MKKTSFIRLTLELEEVLLETRTVLVPACQAMMSPKMFFWMTTGHPEKMDNFIKTWTSGQMG
jgi:hypothetical protein